TSRGPWPRPRRAPASRRTASSSGAITSVLSPGRASPPEARSPSRGSWCGSACSPDTRRSTSTRAWPSPTTRGARAGPSTHGRSRRGRGGFGDGTVQSSDRSKARALKEAIESVPGVVYEAHSTDYQTTGALRRLVEDHFAILKVGPALTFAFREAVFALANLEEEWLGGRG